jgi:dephospho-CoA kinase
MLKVGLTGGYATGKSLVAAELERLGCHLIYADKLGHAALSPEGAAYQPAIEIFGHEILSPDGTIDRKRLASIVLARRSCSKS